MDQVKPKSIQTVGLLIMIFSGFTIFSNLGGLYSADFMGEPFTGNDNKENAISSILNYYADMCLFMIILGLLYLFGGIFISKYKLWANRLITIISFLLILIIWFVMISIVITVGSDSGFEIFIIGFIFAALLFSIPIALLIRFLNKRNIKIHFE